ncbi:MAG: hypothetical protein NDI82_02955 [Anaeromyxobacteraceae bacterium]|nr:hypothetical protein [Anaeromyxobacteraceae bacterium]
MFSTDGRHVAWVSSKDGRTVVALDGAAGRPVEGARALTFHAATGRLAYVAAEQGRERVIDGGQEGPAFDAIGTLRFTPAGQALYSARRGDRWVVRLGEREVVVASAADPEPQALADGAWIVFAAGGAEGKAHLRACASDLGGCVSGAPHEQVAELKVDPAGQRLAFIATDAAAQRPVTARIEKGALVETAGSPYPAVTRTTFSADGRHLAFLVERETGYAILLDGKEQPAPPMDSPLDLIAAGGRSLLSAVIQNEVVALVDGAAKVKAPGSIDYLVASADGSGHAFATGADGREFVMVNGQAGPPFDKVVTPRFTPDGGRVVYRARQSGERFVVVADSQGKTLREHPHHGAVFDVVIAADGKSVGYGVRSGDDLLWVEEPL